MSTRSVISTITYTAPEKRLAVEALRRYGAKPAEVLLAELWPERSPVRRTMYAWSTEHGADFEPTERERQFWDKWEDTHRARMAAEVSPRLPKILEAMDRALAKDDAKAVRDLAVSFGILYDKLVPVASGGVGAFPGGTPSFTITTYAAAPALAQVRELVEAKLAEAVDGGV